MKKFELDLTSWDTEVSVQKNNEHGNPVFVQEKIEYPLKENLGMMLRAGGLFENTEDTVEAILLGRTIQARSEDSIEIDERELGLLKQCLDRHLEAATKGQGVFGGQQHEELILRIHALWKNKDAEGK